MQPRSEATRSRTCSGELQLRRNRIKPTGSATPKKSRSEGVRRSPEHPRITASGALSGNDAPDVAPLQLAAHPLCIRDGGSLDAVKHALFAEIGTNWCGRRTSEQVWIGASDTIPFLMPGFLTAPRSELDPGDTRPLRSRWLCSIGLAF